MADTKTAPVRAAPVRAALVDDATGVVLDVQMCGPDAVAPEGKSYVPSDTAAIGMVHAGGAFAWPPQPLDAVKAAKRVELREACSVTILGGYPSSALGASHTYPSDETSQRNMAASVLDSVVPGLASDWTTPFWCEDGSGKWIFVPHTAAQIQQAGRDGKAWVLAAQGKLVGLEAKVAAATDAATVEAIAW